MKNIFPYVILIVGISFIGLLGWSLLCPTIVTVVKEPTKEPFRLEITKDSNGSQDSWIVTDRFSGRQWAVIDVFPNVRQCGPVVIDLQTKRVNPAPLLPAEDTSELFKQLLERLEIERSKKANKAEKF